MPADSHTHLNDPAFDEDRDEVIAAIENAGIVHLLNVGYDLPTSHKAVDLANRYPFMYAAAGIHPHNAASVNEAVIDKVRTIAQHPKVVAIGETGLDYFRDRSPRDAQEHSLRLHLRLAHELQKPVIIHCRDAMEDTLRILEEENVADIGGVMHCFAGTPDDVRHVLDLGMYISFAGNITYPKAQNLRDSLAAVPGHKLLIETDAPYLSPQKNRGTRNDSTLLHHVIECAATVRGVTHQDIERIALTNFEELFLKQESDGKVAYVIRNSLYLNVTQSCTNECYFCVRFFSDSVQGHNLRLPRDPKVDEMIQAIGDPKEYDEIVFCGYGEPTIHLERILDVARWVKENGGRTRLNSNGHGNHLAKRDITPGMVGLIDQVSISLNADNATTYDEICKPLIPRAYETTLDFIRAAKSAGLSVTATVVAIPDLVDVEACRRLAEDELEVSFRVRPYDLVG